MRTSKRAVLLVAGMLLAAAACQGDDDASTSNASASTGTTTTITTTPPPPPSCLPGDGYGPGTTTHTLSVANTEREFLVHRPAEPTAGMALIVDFHGAGSNMTRQDNYSGFARLADEEGFMVATPNGVDAAVRQWRFLGTPDDLDFAKAIVAELVANACVDPARVYAAGISSGAAMSASLACQASDVFKGFGLVAANFYAPALCGRAERRPIMTFHGTDDRAVPYAGGDVLGGPIQVMPAEQTAQRWAEHNGCTSGPEETTVGTEVVRLDWAGCDEPVVFYRIVGGGHTWPGAIDVDRLGMTTDQVHATEEMWRLFDENR